MWQRYRLSLSFANLVYLRAWADLIPLHSTGLFHRKTVPGFGLYFGLVADVVALSLVIFGLACVAPKLPPWLRRMFPVAAIAILTLAWSFLRSHLPDFAPRTVLTAAVALIVGIAAILAFGYTTAAVRLLRMFAVAATPCLAVTFLAPLYYLNSPSPLPADPPLATRLPGTPPVRVLWIVFDDWDQRLTFDNTDGVANVPSLIQFTFHSFAAHNARAVLADTVPVAGMATNAAIPSLLYGKLTVSSEIEGPATRTLAFAGSGGPIVFGEGNSIFARFRTQGWNSAVAGWFIPYCRIFAPVLTDCYWDEMYDQASSASHSAPQAAVDETRMLFESDMFSPFGDSVVASRHFAEYEALVDTARRYAANPSLGLAFIHFNVPHMPFFYNSALGRFGRKDHPNDLYIDDLRYVDRAVSETLAALQKSGLDSRTAIIISSDHPARLITKTDPHVPFIVHLPGQTGGAFSMREFSAIHTANLAMAIARGNITTPVDVEEFLIHDP